MKAFRVVADSSCLIGLVHIGLFDKLCDIFLKVFVPDTVYNEVVVQGQGRTGADEVVAAVQAGWPAKSSVQDTLAVDVLLTNLSRGEAEVIILAKELSLDYALIDEKIARNVAALMNVKTIGVLGLIDMAILAGVPVQKKTALDQLR